MIYDDVIDPATERMKRMRRARKQRFRERLVVYGGGAVLIVVMALAFAYEKALWDECRSFGHSWGYCARVLGQ